MNTVKLMSGAAAVVLAGLTAAPAIAGTGTAAGTSVTNTATVNFNVGGVAQTQQSAANTFVVDNKIILTDTLNQAATTAVSPGQNGAVMTYQVSNGSNTTIDIALAAAAQSTGATAAHGGSVNQTATTYTYYVNSSSPYSTGTPTCTYSAGSVTQVTWLDEVPAGNTACVYVLANIPAAATNGQVAGTNLTVTAEAGGATGTQGAVLTASSGAWTPGTVQTVLADGTGNGTGDTNYDGKYTALGDYTVSSAVLSVNKIVTVISDPVNGTSNPKSIPGATLQYCIVVANAAGAGQSATNLSISDVLPSFVTYKASSVYLNAAVTGSGATATCAASGGAAGTDGTNWNAGSTTVSGNLANLAAGSSEGLLFQVTIN